MAPRLIRRRPLAERIKTYLNPLDFLLWLSEELDSNEWAQWKLKWAIPIGVALNVLFLIARANSVQSTRGKGDDVFADDEGYAGWLAWVVGTPTYFGHNIFGADSSRRPLSFMFLPYLRLQMLFTHSGANVIIDYLRIHLMHHQSHLQLIAFVSTLPRYHHLRFAIFPACLQVTMQNLDHIQILREMFGNLLCGILQHFPSGCFVFSVLATF